jgi:hypothetical protein
MRDGAEKKWASSDRFAPLEEIEIRSRKRKKLSWFDSLPGFATGRIHRSEAVSYHCAAA